MGWTHDCRLSLLRTSCQVSFGNASSFRNKTCSCEPMLSKESKFTSNVAKIPWKIPQNPCYSRVKSPSCSLPPFCDVFPLFTRPADFKNFDCLCVARDVLAPDFRFLKCWLLRTRDKSQIKYGVHEHKQCSNDQNILGKQLPGRKYRQEKLINGWIA